VDHGGRCTARARVRAQTCRRAFPSKGSRWRSSTGNTDLRGQSLALSTDHDITFIGLCGATTDAEVGSVVEAREAYAWDGTLAWRRWPYPMVSTEVSVATVSCLAASASGHDDLAAGGVCVDLETAWIYAAAAATGGNARAVLAVSDRNQGGSVFSTSASDVEVWLADALATVLAGPPA
jgi:hypothetical protein